MKKGLSRFMFYTDQLKALLNEARDQNNPAMWLFKNNARTPSFMLEALARIYSEMHNPKRFGKLKDQFKLIEDGLGQIDYYNMLYQAFSTGKRIPAMYRNYIKSRLEQSAADLNETLTDKEWLPKPGVRIKKITKKLKDANWMASGKEIEALSDIYRSSIAEIEEFVAGKSYTYDNVEVDVHELRRKLRWLSIYPQALRGAIQYAEGRRSSQRLKKYLTEEILNSPYNKLPQPGSNASFLLLNKNYFLCLSWMIAKLGELKDEGLLLTGLTEAIKQVTSGTDEEVMSKAKSLLGRNQRSMQTILDEAEEITKTFISEKILQHLITVTK